jgi:hypothetical protein
MVVNYCFKNNSSDRPPGNIPKIEFIYFKSNQLLFSAFRIITKVGIQFRNPMLQILILYGCKLLFQKFIFLRKFTKIGIPIFSIPEIIQNSHISTPLTKQSLC